MRHKHNKRKEAFVKSQKAPKRRIKEDRDKDVFKRRKFIKNVVEDEQKTNTEEQSSSEEEEETVTGYGQMMQMFGGNVMDNHAIESDSEEEGDGSDREVGEEQADKREGNSDSEDDPEAESDEDDEGAGVLSDEEPDNGETEDTEELEEEEANEADLQLMTGDPFSAHFELDIDQSLMAAVDDKSKWKTTNIKMPCLGNLQVQTLNIDHKVNEVKKLMDDEKDDAQLRQAQRQLISCVPNPDKTPQLFLKQKLGHVERDSFEEEVLGILSQYKDFMFTDRSKENAEQIRRMYTLHVLNHVLKTRTKILNNNAKHEARSEGDEKLRDQGFSRPKVLIIVPFKESCRSIVEHLIRWFSPEKAKGSVSNRKRFNEDYAKVETVRKDKPDDFYDTFQGDIDDSFKLGISVSKKTLKLYTDFYSSDIIIASPLGLRLVTGVEGEGGARTDTDFLSSVEVVVVDQAEVLLMQNWDHVTTALAQLHHQPKETHGVDYGRIRLWCLDGHSKYYRQTVLVSGVPCPEINAVWNRNCTNYTGKVRALGAGAEAGAMASIVCDTSLVWHRVTADSLAQSLEARFQYFTERVMPHFKKDSMYHTCVFVPSYFDFVKVRNWFKSSDLDYSEVSEYSKDKKIAQARDMFYHNEKHFLLYTERCHFYRRFRLKGIRHLIFYQPPTFGWMFSELSNLLQKSFQNPRGGSETNMSITVIYTKYDIQRIKLCVGAETASKMLSSENSRHIFQPGAAE